MRKSTKIWLLGLTLAVTLQAHEGHEAPGAVPPPPHGGRLGLAADSDEHDEKHEHHHEGNDKAEKHHEETNLYFEAVLEGKELSLYPLILAPGPHQDFKSASPKELSALTVKTQRARSRTIEAFKPTWNGDRFVGEFEPKRTHRFTVFITVVYENEMKTTKLQIETQ